MKKLFSIASLNLLLLLFAVPGTSYGQNIEGTYNLYRADDPAGGAIGSMTIYQQNGNTFLIKGSGWNGNGSVTLGIGYYNWKFTNGNSGSTTITVLDDGTINGRVQGPADNEGLNWRYIAKPVSRPVQTCNVFFEKIVSKDDGHDYLQFKNTCTYSRTVNVCVTFEDGTKNLKSVVVPGKDSAKLEYRFTTGLKATYSYQIDKTINCN